MCLAEAHKAISNITSNTSDTKHSSRAAAQQSSWHGSLSMCSVKMKDMLPLS